MHLSLTLGLLFYTCGLPNQAQHRSTWFGLAARLCVMFAAQVSIEAPAPSIAALAMHKWLQDMHVKVQTEGPSCLPKRVALSVGLYVCTPAAQTPPLAPPKAEAAPRQLPREPGIGPSQVSAEAGAPAGSQEAVAAAGSLPEAKAATDDAAGPSSPGLSPVGSRSPQSGQKWLSPALPAVAAKIFGPDCTAAANQAAVLDMVRGFGLPFKVMDVESSRSRLEADGAAVAEWLQAEQFGAIMTSFARPLTSPVAGTPPKAFATHCLL